MAFILVKTMETNRKMPETTATIYFYFNLKEPDWYFMVENHFSENVLNFDLYSNLDGVNVFKIQIKPNSNLV